MTGRDPRNYRYNLHFHRHPNHTCERGNLFTYDPQNTTGYEVDRPGSVDLRPHRTRLAHRHSRRQNHEILNGQGKDPTTGRPTRPTEVPSFRHLTTHRVSPSPDDSIHACCRTPKRHPTSSGSSTRFLWEERRRGAASGRRLRQVEYLLFRLRGTPSYVTSSKLTNLHRIGVEFQFEKIRFRPRCDNMDHGQYRTLIKTKPSCLVVRSLAKNHYDFPWYHLRKGSTDLTTRTGSLEDWRGT